MKKHICFAGFGEGDLQALQPSLSALEGAWDCVFSPDAASALDTLASGPFDAAVANLTPGGIDDAELLEQAAIRHPRTMRFVLGDVADRELVVNRMGAAHQFISRPWKPRELVSIIERGLALDAWLSNDTLRSFIPKLGKLPSLPSTYFEVLKRAESPHCTIENIAEIIAHDPALTARLLQMVNSPACGLNRKITSPAEAVARLGLDTVKSVVLCLQLYSQSASVQDVPYSLDQLWRHSFKVAKTSAKIVLNCIASEGMSSEAYTAGLLHNIGQIVLATNVSREYSAVVVTAREQDRPLQEVEKEQLGVTSSQVGAYLLGLWGMPLPIVEAAALHLTPASASSIEFSLLTVVHVANILSYEDKGEKDGLLGPKLDTNYLATLGLPQKTAEWRKLLSTTPANVNGPNSNLESHIAAQVGPPAPAKPPREKLSIPFKKIFVCLILVGLMAGAVVIFKNRGLVAQKVNSVLASTVAKSPPAAPAPDPAAPAPAESTPAPAPAGFNALKLETILYSPAHHVALINGKALEVGDRFDGIEVLSITPNSVLLAAHGQQRTLKLKP